MRQRHSQETQGVPFEHRGLPRGAKSPGRIQEWVREGTGTNPNASATHVTAQTCVKLMCVCYCLCMFGDVPACSCLPGQRRACWCLCVHYLHICECLRIFEFVCAWLAMFVFVRACLCHKKIRGSKGHASGKRREAPGQTRDGFGKIRGRSWMVPKEHNGGTGKALAAHQKKAWGIPNASATSSKAYRSLPHP